ncbi:MAG: DUF58 domain-containing protein [Planctomycetota bacterium]|jgi:uncharacterized protein (DUF58 family)
MRRTDGTLRLGLTDAGKTILCGTGYVALAALIVPAFGVLSVLVSIVLMALLVGFVLRPKIQISGNLPDRIIVDQTVRLRYTLKNVARLPAYNLCVRLSALPEAIEQVEGGSVVTRLGPGETTEVTVAIRPKRRGYYRIKQPICQSSFPFNLFSFGTLADDEQTLIVLPTFSRLQIPLRRLSRYVQASGARLTGHTGEFLEYVGNRPFVSGDSPRRIDTRAWARLSVPATKEYHDDFDYYTALVLDTSVPNVRLRPRSNEIKELEAAVSLCASVAFTINNDCLIDLLLAGPDLHQFTAWSRTVRLDKIHEILAGVEPSKGYALERVAPILTERFHKISEAYFILLSWNEMYRQLLELAGQAGCRSTVLLIHPSSRMHVDQDDVNWTGNVRFLSPDEILTGQIKRL